VVALLKQDGMGYILPHRAWFMDVIRQQHHSALGCIPSDEDCGAHFATK
jgi:hypothetical protein